MEGNNFHGPEHADNPEESSPESLFNDELKTTTQVVKNALDALWPKGKSSAERRLRDRRLEAADILDAHIHEYLTGRGNTIVPVMSGYYVLYQLHEQVVEQRNKVVTDVDINAIVRTRNEVFDALDYPEGLPDTEDPYTSLVVDAFDTRNELMEEFAMLGQAMGSHDSVVTQWIKSLGKGIEATVTMDEMTPLLFVERSLPNLIVVIKEADAAIKAMPLRHDQWRVVRAKNNDLRRLLAQITKFVR